MHCKLYKLNFQSLDTNTTNRKPLKLRALRFLKRLTPITLASSVFIGSSSSAQALQFNFTYAPGTSFEQMLGYEMAGKYWSNYLTDDVTLNIFIETTNMLPTNVIGGAIPGVTSKKLETVYEQIQADATSAADQTSLANVYTKDKGYEALTSTYKNGSRTTNSSKGMNNINLTRANAKALGLINGNDTGYDGYILISDLSNLSKPLSWNYFSETNNSSTIATGTLDFFSVAVHELTHTLGFISAIDSPEYGDLLNKKSSISGGEASKYAYLMDLFRLSGNSFTNGNKPDMSIGVDSMLSINAGTSKLGNMSSGSTKFGGDGNQGSHWKKDATYDGIMEASLGAGDNRNLATNNDLTVLDVLGWDLQQNNQSLLTIFNSAKSGLASKMGVTTSWMDANSTLAALRLTPQFIDTNGNGKDDRGESLNKMVNDSGAYNWGWNNYWWGWNGRWQGWNGYWQSSANLTADGFWQNATWETLDEFEDGEHNHDHDHDHLSSYSQSVPEPSSTLGLLGLVLFGIRSMIKGQGKK
ncbi:MAG: NF038122 family metalloprotease [Desmonostoc vinosum HA7617-LM4]|nr:NF038122 family metalloprotease [Desmonostoc vinosum HA7617-LM4]